ncbi:gamma-glutamyltransferase [Vibrio lentus]|nr:gamma-glutamyltransferase [Vibrio lentus]
MPSKDKRPISHIDGRDEAPSSATPDMFMEGGKTLSVGNDFRAKICRSTRYALILPLYVAHIKNTASAWSELVQPAIELASKGYAMNSYTYDIVVREQERLIEDPEIKALFIGITARQTNRHF